MSATRADPRLVAGDDACDPAVAFTMATARINETRLAAVFEAAVDGIIIIDPAGTIQTVNPAIERMFGCSSDMSAGLTSSSDWTRSVTTGRPV